MPVSFSKGGGVKENVISTDSTKHVINLAYFKELLKNIFGTYPIWSFMHCNKIITDAVSLLRYGIEQEVDQPVILNVMTPMWRHCNNNVS